MKRLLPAFLLGCGLVGCQDYYSADIRYGVRTDPLVKPGQEGKLGEDRYGTDRPGIMPVMKIADISDPLNPIYPKSADVLKLGVMLDPSTIATGERQTIEKALEELFGTPAKPKVAELTDDQRKALKLDDAALLSGGHLFRIHCVHCHGVAGDGRGPTARWVNPHPRDFRQRLFKFTSIDQSRGKTGLAPRREDIHRVIRNGVEGTAMSSYHILKDVEVEDLVGYVTMLSMRGKAEFDTIVNLYDAENGKLVLRAGENLADAIKDYHGLNVKNWMESQDDKNAIAHTPFDAAKEKDFWKKHAGADAVQVKANASRALFANTEPTDAVAKELLALRGDKPGNVNCTQCHKNFGREAQFKFDAWGTLVRPNNLPQGIFRGGRRPVDIYNRIHSGINGSGMTPFGDPKTMSNNSIWDMVDFVQALSYPAMRAKMGINLD